MRCVFPYFKNDSFHITNTACCSFCHKMAGNSSFKIKWLEKPEYKGLSQIQSKFKAASCNVCIQYVIFNALKEYCIPKEEEERILTSVI